jgi:hypothetical protein
MWVCLQAATAAAQPMSFTTPVSRGANFKKKKTAAVAHTDAIKM